MLSGLVISLLLAVLGSTLYAVILSALKWSMRLRRSLEKAEEGRSRHRYSARCATCGASFMESDHLEDGKCADCDRPLCSHCAAPGWICPLCNKKRDDGYEPKEKRARRPLSYPYLPQSIYKHKEIGSAESLFRERLEEAGKLRKHSRSSSKPYLSPKHSDHGSTSSSGWYSDYESDSELGPSELAPRELGSSDHWEKNWLFKRKLPSVEHMQPLAMFVPSPKEEHKARIGGVEVDELSDLSDYSDTEILQIIK